MKLKLDFKLDYILTILALLIAIALSNIVASTKEVNYYSHPRFKRDLTELTALLVKDTPYTFYKLSSYGNWCGRGGDKMMDGSYIDGCDLCCKYHDQCYQKARSAHSGCQPLFTPYKYRHGETNPVANQDVKNSEEERELIRRRKLPSCITDENEAPSCKEAICQCDVQFAICLKKQPCDPKTVSKKSRFWWLPG